jgi:hypothetical protein
MAKYRKKPVVIEAVQFTGNNFTEIMNFMNKNDLVCEVMNHVIIPTLEGDMICSLNDYVIRGVVGEFYPCKEDIFHKTYEEVEK